MGAICAGNCCVIKPSELSTASEKLLAEVLPRYIDSECFKVVRGGVETTKALLAQKWDKIFFTGSTRVGKIVMRAAAENLTPVSLELGGKSPTIIDESVGDLQLAADRILWGKLANAGQTCIAPDYVLCHEKHFDKFLACAKSTILKFYGSNQQKSIDFGRIVSRLHCERLQGLIEDSKDEVFFGGDVDIADRYIQPTIIANPKIDSKVMLDEIFGPILPVIKISSTEQALNIIATMPKPLAMYIFAKNKKTIDHMIGTVSCGGVVVNDTMFHCGNSHIPFGGVGTSGLGSYHGAFSFKCFSHEKAVMRRDDHKILDVQALR